MKNKNKEISELPSLSKTEAIILDLLVKCPKEMYGLEMIEASGKRLKRGTIYVTLQRMTDKGYVESREEARPAPEIGIPRRLYRATGLGERVYHAYESARDIFRLKEVSA
jgi:PadR family transcriptional regulator